MHEKFEDTIRAFTATKRLDGKGLPKVDESELYRNRIPRSLSEVFLGARTVSGMSMLIDGILYNWKAEKVSREEATRQIKLAVKVVDQVLDHHRELFDAVADEFVSDSLFKFGHFCSPSATEAVYGFACDFIGQLRLCLGQVDFDVAPMNFDDITCSDLERVRNIFLFSWENYNNTWEEDSHSFLRDQLSLELARAVRNRKLAGYAPPWDEYVKLDDPNLEALERRHPTSVTLRRDFYLLQRKGDSCAKLADHWNELSEKERKDICPRRFDEVTEAAVKQQLKRLRENLRDMRSDREKNREF